MSDQVNEIKEEIEGRAVIYGAALHQWENVYEATHPKPTRRKVSMRQFGVEFLFTLVTTASSIVLAAMRTGFQFFLSALATANRYLTTGIVGTAIDNNTAIVFAMIEMIAAVFGVEGLLLVAGLSKGRKTGITTVPVAGIVIAGAISVAAGLGQSFGLVPQLGLSTGIDVTIAMITGLGASAVVFFSAEALGATLNKYEEALRQADNDYRTATQLWYANMQESFNTEGRRKLLRIRQPVQSPVPEETPKAMPERVVGPTETIIQFLVVNSLTPKDVGREGRISPRQLSELTGVPGNTARPLIERLQRREEEGEWK